MRKIFASFVVSLFFLSFLKAENIKCDSKDAMIAFAMEVYELGYKEIKDLDKTGETIYRSFGMGGSVTLGKKELSSNTIGSSSINDLVYKNFKLIEGDEYSATCEVSYEEIGHSKNDPESEPEISKGSVRFTLTSGYKAELENDNSQ